jgi:hypothetical protein
MINVKCTRLDEFTQSAIKVQGEKDSRGLYGGDVKGRKLLEDEKIEINQKACLWIRSDKTVNRKKSTDLSSYFKSQMNFMAFQSSF